MRGKYLVQNFWLYFFLKLADCFFHLFKRNKYLPPISPKKILISHLGHLGDLVIATSVLPLLKRAFPHAKLGFLASSWSKAVIENHPFIDKLHLLDHWKLNRSKSSLGKKVYQYFKSFFSSYQEIRKEGYDAAIDLYFYYPNSILLLSLARIPRRIGYTSSGFGSLLTDAIDWTFQEQYVSEYYKPLLKKIGVEERFIQNMKPFLRVPSEEKQEALLQKLSKTAQEKGYWILHMGASADKKEWPLEKWKGLAKKISGEGFFIVFTGHGEEEKKRIDQVKEGLANVQSLCNELSWDELVLLIQKATILISVDTVVTHIAFAFGVPTLILFSGGHFLSHYVPPHVKTIFSTEMLFSHNAGSSSPRSMDFREEAVLLKAKELF